MPYTVQRVCDPIPMTAKMIVAELDDEVGQELIEWSPHHVLVNRLVGTTMMNLLDYSSGQDSIWASVVPVEDEKRHLLAIRSVRQGKSLTRLIDLSLSEPAQRVDLEEYPAVAWLLREGGKGIQPAVEPVLLARAGSRRVLLARVHPVHFPAPRALVGYEWPSGKKLWEHRMGPIPGYPAFADIDGDGLREIVVGTYSPCNGREADGMRDDESWVLAYRIDGTELWRYLFGGPYRGAVVQALDLEGDGNLEVVVGGLNANGRDPTLQPLTVLDAAAGTIRRTTDWAENVSTLHLLHGFLEGGKEAILATTRDHGLLLLDTSLRIVHRSSPEQALHYIASMSLPGTNSDEQFLLLESPTTVQIVNRKLHPVAWIPVSKDTDHSARIMRLADGTSVVALHDQPWLHLLQPRVRPWFARWEGEITTRPIAAISIGLVLLAASGTLVGRRRRTRPSTHLARELAVTALDLGHRGECLAKLDGIRTAWAELVSAAPNRREKFRDWLVHLAGSWDVLLRPRLQELAEIAARLSPDSRVSQQLLVRVRLVDVTIRAALADPNDENLLMNLAPTGRRTMDDLLTVLARCQESLAPMIVSNPAQEWMQLVAVERMKLNALGVEVEPVDTDLGLKAVIAPLDLRRILENLLANAAHAMSGAAVRRVSFRAWEQDRRFVMIEISDTGTGMTAARRERIRTGGAGGIGYPLVQTILSHYAGRLDLQANDPLPGTTARLVLQPQRALLASGAHSQRPDNDQWRES